MSHKKMSDDDFKAALSAVHATVPPATTPVRVRIGVDGQYFVQLNGAVPGIEDEQSVTEEQALQLKDAKAGWPPGPPVRRS